MTTQMFERKCLNCERLYPADVMVCEEDGTQLAAILTHSLIGDTLGGGKYELLQELGRGGMGVVFRARHRLMDRVVAIKMLIDDLGRDESALARFHVEAKAAAALSHANIIRIYDFDVSPHGFPFIVMDFLQGTPLDALLEAEKRMEWSRALPVFLKVCDALGHAHRRQVVHRDIKPSNIMLVLDDDDEEKPIVLDFGIAKLFTQAGKTANRLTRTGEIFGSPLYMSPEQCLGQPIDPRSDIYSLGCLIHETLTGQAPFERSGFLQVILAHINAPIPTLEQSAPDLVFPPGLSDVLGKAIAKDSNDRYESMQDFKKALAMVGGCAAGAHPASGSAGVSGDASAGASGGTAGVSGGSSAGGSGSASAHTLPDSGDRGSNASTNAPAGAYVDGDINIVGAGTSSGDSVRSGDTVRSAGGAEPVIDDTTSSEFTNLLASAEAGDVEAQYDLSWNYRRGESGAPKDPKMAFYWMLRAAQQAKTAAMNVISDMYQDGEGVMQDYAEAFKWRRKSAEAGDQLGQWNLGYMYCKSMGCEEDADLCAYWYRAAAEQGHDGAQADMGWCYTVGYGVEVDDEQAYDWFAKAAAQGNKYAQTKVARALRWGWGIHIDLEEAVVWYTHAAEQGDLDAQYELSQMMFRGEGCRQDRMEAQRRLRNSAEKGNADAQNYLGSCCEWGWHGTPINFVEAVGWYRKAAQQNDPDGEYNLGAMYEEGKGVPQDDKEALRWYRRSAEDGSAAGMQAYARCLLEGIACTKNEPEAIKWFKDAVEKGNSSAQFRLTQLIEQGKIPDPENYDVMELLRLAADQDHMEAQYTLGLRLIEQGNRDEGLNYLRTAAELGYEDASDELKKYEST